ncbi:hypothetical protein [Streptomyces capillispiralis]|uniref:Uncharacterized protein n=1 Tax=Streptomyces capillispiralis TaxID=68182 RepID=A0A561TEJ4_9ACTN|nr:hypothetical protein [Streptomyces capillispiralis]TWF85529.1 hypothetical protein FHX78_112481 [Streptomyces capillispiralis]
MGLAQRHLDGVLPGQFGVLAEVGDLGRTVAGDFVRHGGGPCRGRFRLVLGVEQSNKSNTGRSWFGSDPDRLLRFETATGAGRSPSAWRGRAAP